MNIPYFSLIERLQTIKTQHYYGVNMRNGMLETIKIYFLIRKEDYIPLYEEYFKQTPHIEDIHLPFDYSTYKVSLYKHPCIAIKIQLQGLPSISFYHLDKYRKDYMILKSIDTEHLSERQYIYKHVSKLSCIEHPFISLKSIPDNTYVSMCYGTMVKEKPFSSYTKVSFIPHIELPAMYTSQHQHMIQSILRDYYVVGNSIGSNGYLSYYFCISHPCHIVQQIYDIYFLLHPYKHFICPITSWYISKPFLDDLSIIRREFKHFQSLNTDFLTLNGSYKTPTKEAVEWIKESHVQCTRETPYPTYVGYEKSLCSGIWTFLPIYYKNQFYLENAFPNTIQKLRNVGKLHMAGFMILKSQKEIEWHRHQTDHTIFHFNISDQEISDTDVSVMLTNCTEIKDNLVLSDSIEKMQLGTYGSCCAFYTDTYHHTVNRSNHDRVSFVIELDHKVKD